MCSIGSILSSLNLGYKLDSDSGILTLFNQFDKNLKVSTKLRKEDEQ